MMLRRLDGNDFAAACRWAGERGLLRPSDPSAIFIDFDVLDDRLQHLRAAFPAATLHAIAIKANPLLGVLRHIVARGFGLEAASFEEVLLARRAGVPAERLVWDSPVKRPQEINYCERHLPGMLVNANCLEELPRLAKCRHLRIGLRINPLLDAGAPGMFAVSESGSKFGVPISESGRIIDAFRRMSQLVGLHVHVGSEIARLDEAAAAIQQVFALADEIERACGVPGGSPRISYMDVGGGFPAEYGTKEQAGLGEYVELLRQRIDSLAHRPLVTEFGRFVHAHAGWLLTNVEYRLEREERTILMLHHGADMFVRETYWPGAPRHRVFAMDRHGHLKTGPLRLHALAGPLCFAGDFLDKDCQLPAVEAGERIVVADTGANTFALWSRHCSRAFPKVIGYSVARDEIRVLKRRESASAATAVWG